MSFLPKPSASVYERAVPITLKLRPSIAALAAKQFTLNPSEFHVEYYAQVEHHLVAMVVYPSCTNYEGRKILVFENTSIGQLESCRLLDPHFVDDAPSGALVPVARFEPTTRGWKLGKICAAAL